MKLIAKLMFIILLFGCSQPSEDQIRNGEEKKKEKERQEIIASIKQKYNVKYSWDDFLTSKNLWDYRFTISYKPVLETNYQIFEYENYKLNDIFEKEGNEYASITVGFMFYFVFPVTREIRDKLLIDGNPFVVVVSIDDIKKIDFNFDEDISGNIKVSVVGPKFTGKGKIIEIIALP
ncbi:MAG: hypothetical protein WCP85_12650 [Mariniphaga sp.]